MNMKDIQQKVQAEKTERLNAKIAVLLNGIRVDLSDIWEDCEAAGYRSFKRYESTGGGQNQCSNTLEGSTCGIYGEAATEKMFQSMGVKYNCGWRDWLTGIANDRLPDGMMDKTPIQVKSIMNIEQPIGQITVPMAQKYSLSNTTLVFVFIDVPSKQAFIYAMGTAKDIVNQNIIEKNLKGNPNYQAIGVTDMLAVRTLIK